MNCHHISTVCTTEWVVHQAWHLMEHLKEMGQIHKEHARTHPATVALAGRNVAQASAKKKWGHVIPTGGEDRGRFALREADFSKYLMSFRTIGLFQPVHLQNNSHQTAGLVIIWVRPVPLHPQIITTWIFHQHLNCDDSKSQKLTHLSLF